MSRTFLEFDGSSVVARTHRATFGVAKHADLGASWLAHWTGHFCLLSVDCKLPSRLELIAIFVVVVISDLQFSDSCGPHL